MVVVSLLRHFLGVEGDGGDGLGESWGALDVGLFGLDT